MKHILVIGAGRSSSSLLKVLLEKGEEENWQILVADADKKLASAKTSDYVHATAHELDILNESAREALIAKADLVISMVPAMFHIHVAKTCIKLKKNMISASYVSEDIAELDDAAKAAGIIILKECGLDPGIDHMSAMEAIDDIRAQGGELTAFKSFTGGLVSPESDNNPWHYKFTWNPRNVVLAGQSTARFIRNGRYKYVPYHKLFSRVEKIAIEGFGEFEGYPNRDSLSYRRKYTIEDIPTLLRGTLRRPGYCEAWDLLVQLGMTDDSYQMEGLEDMTLRDFTNAFLFYDENAQVEEKFCSYLKTSKNGEAFSKIVWLGLFDKTPLPIKKGSPAQILEKILENKWTLEADDKDMIVMQHQFDYILNDTAYRKTSSLVVKGDDQVQTAMSKTVGYPLAIGAALILEGKIDLKGVHIPTDKRLYAPLLKGLKALDIIFEEKEKPLKESMAL